MLLRRSNSTVSIKNIINLTGLTRHTQSIGEFLKNKYTSDQFNMYITLMNERLTTKAVVIDGDKEYSVEFDKLWKMCGYSRKDPAKRVLEAQLHKDRDWIFFHNSVENSGRGRPTENIYLTLDAAQHLVFSKQTEQGTVIRQFFIDTLKYVQEYQLVQTSNDATIQARHDQFLKIYPKGPAQVAKLLKHYTAFNVVRKYNVLFKQAIC